MPSTMGALPADALFLGFDSSTQSLKATVIDAALRVHASETVHFDSELPHYNTKDGVHRDSKVQGRITGPVLMWVEALDLVLTKLENAKFPFNKVYAVSGSGQQHGSVYWAKGALEAHLKNLDSSKGLVTQLQGAFSIEDSPVWMDSSTAKQCLAIEEALGGPATLTALTGSRAHDRYTGPQIRKIFETQEGTYHGTERISLVSSFMASLLVGTYAAIDHSDGAGMNLMDLLHRTWSLEALKTHIFVCFRQLVIYSSTGLLEAMKSMASDVASTQGDVRYFATAPNLEEKLGPLAAPHAVAGNLSKYFVERFKFSPDCVVIQWSGDNPCSLAGLALNRPGDLAISLGTSDTVFGVTRDPHPGLEGHVFPNPVDPDSYMAMLVYKNGSLTREEIRNQCANGSWETFSDLIKESPPLNGGKMGFYCKEPEILPPLPVGYYRYVLGQHGSTFSSLGAQKVTEFDSVSEVRAIVEGQFLSMRIHAERIGMPSPPERVIATGGGSANRQMLALIASIFGCDVYTAQRPDSASLGAALRAAHGWLCKRRGTFVPISTMLESSAEESAFQCGLQVTAVGHVLHARYGKLASVRAEIEKQLLNELHLREVL